MKNILIALLLTGIQVISLTAATTLNFSNSLMSVDGNGNPVVNIILPLETNLPNLNVSGGVSVQNPAGTNRILGTTIISSNTAMQQPQYVDLQVSTFALGGGANAPLFTAITGHQTGYMGYDTTPDFSYGTVQMPHNLAVTNADYPELVLIPHVHWCSPIVQAPDATNVAWRLAWRYTPKFSTNTLAGTNFVLASVGSHTNEPGFHVLTEICRITNNTASISDDFSFRIDRVTTNNEASGRICLMYFDLHVPTGNKTILGSRTELTQ